MHIFCIINFNPRATRFFWQFCLHNWETLFIRVPDSFFKSVGFPKYKNKNNINYNSLLKNAACKNIALTFSCLNSIWGQVQDIISIEFWTLENLLGTLYLLYTLEACLFTLFSGNLSRGIQRCSHYLVSCYFCTFLCSKRHLLSQFLAR